MLVGELDKVDKVLSSEGDGDVEREEINLIGLSLRFVSNCMLVILCSMLFIVIL